MSNGGDLTKDQIQKYRMMFTMIDLNGDDLITKDDIKAVAKDLALDIDDSVIDKHMLAEGDGKLDFNGFLKIVAAKSAGFSDAEELKDAFATFRGADGIDGKILKENLTSVAGEESEREAIKQVAGDYIKENKITGFQKFKADKFIDDVKK